MHFLILIYFQIFLNWRLKNVQIVEVGGIEIHAAFFFFLKQKQKNNLLHFSCFNHLMNIIFSMQLQ